MGTVIVAVGGLAAAVVALLVLRAAPRLTVVLWLVALFFVPVWVGVSIGPFWSAITLMTVLAIATCSSSIELSPADGIMAAFALLIVAQYVLDFNTLSGTVIALSEWLLPYVWGRLILTRVSLGFLVRAVSVIAAAAALLALLEFMTSTNLFVLLPANSSSLYEVWAPLQPRGGIMRVEGAFGHSIALGATLSMCAAFVLASKWKLLPRLVILAVIGAAIVFTLSRIGLVALVITVALSVLVLPGLSVRARLLTGAAGLAGVGIVVPFVNDVFLEAGGEAGGSADYRFDLLALELVLRPFGAAPDIAGLTVNGQYLGAFSRSIDNALLVAAMRVGWIPALLLIGALAIAVVQLLRRGGANVASIAIAGQIPSLFAVAFITQYSAFFWFSVGLAIALGLESRRGRSSPSAEFHRAALQYGDLSAPAPRSRPSPDPRTKPVGGRL